MERLRLQNWIGELVSTNIKSSLQQKLSLEVKLGNPGWLFGSRPARLWQIGALNSPDEQQNAVTAIQSRQLAGIRSNATISRAVRVVQAAIGIKKHRRELSRPRQIDPVVVAASIFGLSKTIRCGKRQRRLAGSCCRASVTHPVR